jgi:membrane associated rhomboid family serine protease
MPPAQISVPRPGRALTAIIAANVALYVLELLLLRANQVWVTELFLQASDVFDRGRVWQPFTYVWFHSPQSVSHLLWNMLPLWWMGTRLEQFWGPRRFAIAYGIFALGGGALTLIVALASKTSVLSPLLPGFWTQMHLGASGAVLGVLVAWGLTFGNEEFLLMFIGRIKGRTLILALIALELLTALSYDATSSTSHFGGMIAAFVLCRGLWRPSRWAGLGRRAALLRKKKKIEAELRVIQGGKSGSDPNDWN